MGVIEFWGEFFERFGLNSDVKRGKEGELGVIILFGI